MIYLNLQPSIAEKFSVYELYLSDFQIQPCCPRRYLGTAGIVGHPSHKPFVLWVWEKLFVLTLEKFLKIDGGSGFTGKWCCQGQLCCYWVTPIIIPPCLNSDNFTVGEGKSGHCGVVGVGGDGGHGGGLGGGEGGGSHLRQKFPHSLPCRVLPFEKV